MSSNPAHHRVKDIIKEAGIEFCPAQIIFIHGTLKED